MSNPPNVPIPGTFTLLTLIALMRRMAVVALIDTDGEVNLRLGRTDVYGRLWAVRYGQNVRNVLLLEDGRVENSSYVKQWIMLQDFRRKKGVTQ